MALLDLQAMETHVLETDGGHSGSSQNSCGGDSGLSLLLCGGKASNLSVVAC
jgi:Lanthionine-containing peptide SapB precursor RamS